MIKKIIKAIEKANKIALFYHVNPDGDSLSSSYGLALALKKAYPQKEIKVVSDGDSLFRSFPFISFKKEMFINSIDNSWLTIVGDVSTETRIYRFEEFNKGYFKICFDHHQTPPTMKFDLFWKEPSWIASSMQAIQIAQATGLEFNSEIALNLAIGILTDSGNFSFSLADPLPVELYAFLLQFIDNKEMDNLFTQMKKRTKKDIQIEKFILNNIKYQDNLAYLKVTQNDLDILKIEEKDINIKINKLGNIEGYDRWAMFIDVNTEYDYYIKCSFRSIGADVSKVAEEFNGGGHIRAAGAIAKNWEEVDNIVKLLIAAK